MRTVVAVLSLGVVSLMCPSGALGGDEALDLDSVRRILSAVRSGGGQPPSPQIALDGYSFHWEVDLGAEHRVIAISRNLGGLLLAFRPDGSLLGEKATNEITWLQVFDFDRDGLAEIVTEQITARGTGIVEKSYYINKISEDGVLELWTGTSYHHEMLRESLESGRPRFQVTYGYIYPDTSSIDFEEVRLIHLVETKTKGGKTSSKRHAYALRNGVFQEVALTQ